MKFSCRIFPSTWRWLHRENFFVSQRANVSLKMDAFHFLEKILDNVCRLISKAPCTTTVKRSEHCGEAVGEGFKDDNHSSAAQMTKYCILTRLLSAWTPSGLSSDLSQRRSYCPPNPPFSGMTQITKLLSPAWLTFDDLSHTRRLISEPQRHCLFQTAAAICHYWECRLQTQCLIIHGRLQSTSPHCVRVWLPANYQNRQQVSSIPHQTADDKMNKCVLACLAQPQTEKNLLKKSLHLTFVSTLLIRSHTDGGVTSFTYLHQHRQLPKKKKLYWFSNNTWLCCLDLLLCKVNIIMWLDSGC